MKMKMSIMKLRLSRSKNNKRGDVKLGGSTTCCGAAMSEIQWEVRPGGMLVQKRSVSGKQLGHDVIVDHDHAAYDSSITVRVSNAAQCHDVLIQPTSTFGELKVILSVLTSLEPTEQRVLFRGKEREDSEHLHMVGVGHNDKLLLLQDPAIKDRKNNLLARVGSGRVSPSPFGPPRSVP